MSEDGLGSGSREPFTGGVPGRAADPVAQQSAEAPQAQTKPRTDERSRPDPFEPDVVMIEQWLEAEPLIRAKTLLERLIQHNSWRYGECHLPTLQRRLRGYRLQRIEREMEQMLEAQPRAQADAEPEETAVITDVNKNE